MTLRRRILLGAAALAALLFALLPLASPAPARRPRAHLASSGAIGGSVALRDPSRPAPSEVRRRLAVSGAGTYINDMLVERDSALSRWPDRHGAPLRIWIQNETDIPGWAESYAVEVRNAFLEWNAVHLPVRFAFTPDSTSADVHVAFIDHFDEEISGRTKWARDDDWWITDADITLAVYHRDGPILDDDAMHAMALHEIGHLLGLDHTTDSTSIMAPRVRVRALSRADRATARLLYSLPPGGVR
ncbi:MAG TPA: matrixin family metalloprotease [Gemmatimonadaceae bacterium]